MSGLTIGIIATTCFFIFYNPFQKQQVVSAAITEETRWDSLPATGLKKGDSGVSANVSTLNINGTVNRDSLVLFAKLLLGTPYLYGSTDPAKGFDCSGFITYVFNHFKINVPRSSYDFTNIGQKRSLSTCRQGDLILFTGTDTLERAVGHIGIICDLTTEYPSFIHSSSGKANGVTITSMDNKYYQQRFISVIDLLSPN